MTRIFTALAEWREERREQLRAGRSLGFVPTMGALHEGHLSLVRRSQSENDRTLVSIFVNRTQFDERTDYEKYPRAVDDDLQLLREAGVEAVVLPSDEDIYPDGYRYRVSEANLSKVLEGVYRQGHFDAVLTVVLKLLQLAAADRAYFGEKDWQQLQLVRGMAEAFFLPTVIVACETVREADGLALSSRNRRLTKADRVRAPAFHRALAEAATAEQARRMLRECGFAVDYVDDLEGRRLGAVRLGGVRLIDNVRLNGGPEGPPYEEGS